ncbi:hypothetical protein DNTS_024061 [Danionella cerebrum]|uniref:cGMP-dependent protein kinase n=1 Tax=Danionella cerebrum TaxID=2873325 RepID=A0A553NJF4_9TELE|nr:hypothetical protein DNTS_024061 [Danionella translucida]
MVCSHSGIMGNGSIKAPTLEETCLASSIHETPVWESVEPLKTRILHLEQELARRDQEMQAQEKRLLCLQRELDAKVSQIDKLQDAIGYNSLACSPTAPPRHSRRLLSVINQGSTRFHRVAVEVHRRLKAKEGVSAEPTSRHFCHEHRGHHFSSERQHVHKDSGLKKQINEALMNNDFLKKLEPQHSREMVDGMYKKIFAAEQLVIQEGEPGNFLYVLAAVTQSHIWALDRRTFQNIMMKSTQAKQQEYFSFLRSVSLLKDLPEEKLAKIVDCLEVDYFEKGEHIIREGEEGNTFFIIAKGEVSVTQSTEDFPEPQEIKTLGVGDYFGEKALISEDVRSANIIAKEHDTQCLVVDRETFNQMVGTYEELQAYLKEYVEQLSLSDERRNAVPQSPIYEHAPDAVEHKRLKEKSATLSSSSFLKELQVVATLGMGGFGRVELVKFKDSEETAFALKCIRKKHIVDTRQQEHIYSEKIILQQTNSNFIVRLFRTFRDDKYVYMLMEVCLGGELWSVLRDMSCFEEPTARFCTGCVLEAFDYLHGRGIVYRDLKPENLLLDAEGYIKMKTWTFCGTPEYVAPEVIMNKGHDFGADCWSLGILIFELLTGSPPFTGSDPIRIYTMVLHGIEKVDIPKKISKRPEDLIQRLCKYVLQVYRI